MVGHTHPAAAAANALRDENAKIKADNEKLKADKAQLEAAVAANAAAPTSQKRAKIAAKDDPRFARVTQTLVGITFKKFKFITGEAQEMLLVRAVAHDTGYEDLQPGAENYEANIAKFARIFQGYLVSKLNEERNYVQTRLKKACFAYMDENNGKLPVHQDFLDCANRKLAVNPTEQDEIVRNHDAILFYVDELMPLMSGKLKDFNHKVRYYATISEAKKNPMQAESDVTPETEALGLVMLENYRSRWMESWKITSKIPAKDRKKHTRVFRENKGNHKDEDTLYLYETDHPKLKTFYTDSSSGQLRYGGWSKEGIEHYNTFRQVITKARRKPAGKAWEKEVLALLRKENKINGATFEEESKLKGKKPASKVDLKSFAVNNLFAAVPDDDDASVDLVEV